MDSTLSSAASAVSDDDYDVISNPQLENSVDLSTDHIFEPRPSDDAQDKFETVRWNAGEVQSFVSKGLGVDSIVSRKRVRVYVDGTFDQFDLGHALQLRQAKLAFPSVHLIVGVFSDDASLRYGAKTVWPEVERIELVRHCRWVDEVIKDVPWELTLNFLREKNIDFVAINEGTSVDPMCDKTRVRGYDELKKHGKIIQTRGTNGIYSQRARGCLMQSPSQRATPTMIDRSPPLPGMSPQVGDRGVAC